MGKSKGVINDFSSNRGAFRSLSRVWSTPQDRKVIRRMSLDQVKKTLNLRLAQFISLCEELGDRAESPDATQIRKDISFYKKRIESLEKQLDEARVEADKAVQLQEILAEVIRAKNSAETKCMEIMEKLKQHMIESSEEVKGELVKSRARIAELEAELESSRSQLKDVKSSWKEEFLNSEEMKGLMKQRVQKYVASDEFMKSKECIDIQVQASIIAFRYNNNNN